MTPISAQSHVLLTKLKASSCGRTAQESLRNIAVQCTTIEEFCPIAESLEWRLADLNWEAEGTQPFIASHVPFIVNNSGRMSENAAAILFANCLEETSQEKPVRVLEFGAGTGLFARYFLDAFRNICEQESQDFYSRLLYVVSDRSSRSIKQWKENDLFSDHRDHVSITTCDASGPIELRSERGSGDDAASTRAIFLNYILDVLPSAIVRTGPTGPEELCVRTNFTNHHHLLPQYTELTFPEVQALAVAERPADRAKLISILNLFEYETAFLPIKRKIPFLDEALVLGANGEKILLNYGAIECVEQCLRLLHPQGFLLINDYGPTEPGDVAAHASTQRFGLSTAMGVNFPLLENHFSKNGTLVVKAEGDITRKIHARLLSKTAVSQTHEVFANRFHADSLCAIEAPAEEARRCVAMGRNTEALENYSVALTRNPRDWHLIGEIAEFVALQLKQFQAGLELCLTALELNPCYSTWLWNILGDCLFCLERFVDAHEAYVQALRINSADVRTNFNLSYTFSQQDAYRDALRSIAEGLMHDEQGVYRQRLLDKQQQILSAISGKWLGEQERLLKRSTAFA